MDADRRALLEWARRDVEWRWSHMIGFRERLNLGRFNAEVRELERAGHAAVLAALRDGVKK